MSFLKNGKNPPTAASPIVCYPPWRDSQFAGESGKAHHFGFLQSLLSRWHLAAVVVVAQKGMVGTEEKFF